MSLANQKGSWQSAARRVLSSIALVAATFFGHSSPRGEELQPPSAARPDAAASAGTTTGWQSITEVREALAPASELSPDLASAPSQGGSLIPLTELERARSIYW